MTSAVLTSCFGGADPDLAALQRDPATALRMSDAVELGHFWRDREMTIEGPQRAFDAREFGVQVSDDDVHAYYDLELLRLGWRSDPIATAIGSVELSAWGWCKGAMVFRIGIQDQARAFQPQFYRGQTFKSV